MALNKYEIKDLQKLSKTFDKKLNKLSWEWYDLSLENADRAMNNKVRTIVDTVIMYWRDFTDVVEHAHYEEDEYDRSWIYNTVAENIYGKNILYPSPEKFEHKSLKIEQGIEKYFNDIFYYEDLEENVSGDTIHEELIMMIF